MPRWTRTARIHVRRDPRSAPSARGAAGVRPCGRDVRAGPRGARTAANTAESRPSERAVVAVGDLQERPVDRGRRRRLHATPPRLPRHAACPVPCRLPPVRVRAWASCLRGLRMGGCRGASGLEGVLPSERAVRRLPTRSSARPRPSPRVGVGMRAPSMPSQATAPDRTVLALPRRPADRASPAHSMPAPPMRAFSGVSTLSNRLSWPGPTLSARRPWSSSLDGRGQLRAQPLAREVRAFARVAARRT